MEGTGKVNGSFTHPAARWALGTVWDKPAVVHVPAVCPVCEAMTEGRESRLESETELQTR